MMFVAATTATTIDRATRKWAANDGGVISKVDRGSQALDNNWLILFNLFLRDFPWCILYVVYSQTQLLHSH